MHACGYKSMHGGARLHVFGGAYIIYNYMVVYITYNNQQLAGLWCMILLLAACWNLHAVKVLWYVQMNGYASIWFAVIICTVWCFPPMFIYMHGVLQCACMHQYSFCNMVHAYKNITCVCATRTSFSTAHFDWYGHAQLQRQGGGLGSWIWDRIHARVLKACMFHWD